MQEKSRGSTSWYKQPHWSRAHPIGNETITGVVCSSVVNCVFWNQQYGERVPARPSTRTKIKLKRTPVAPIAGIILTIVVSSAQAYGQSLQGSAGNASEKTFAILSLHGMATPQLQSPESNQPQFGLRVMPQQEASQANPSAQPATIVGTVTDVRDDAVPGAIVVLELPAGTDQYTVTTDQKGFFEIHDVMPGVSYHIKVSASGFADWVSPVITLEPGQFDILTGCKLQVQALQSSVIVTPETNEEVAKQQVRVEELQRGFVIIPNFLAVYAPNPVPLTSKLKFSLAFKMATDRFTIVGAGIVAGANHIVDRPSYEDGMEGLSQRFAASYANSFSDVMIGGAILPSILHQDPRYFYQGRGTMMSRALHAFSTLVITKGDNGRWQPNYSGLGGDVASAALSNAYFPARDRGPALFLQNFGIQTAVHAAMRIGQEFIFPPAK